MLPLFPNVGREQRMAPLPPFSGANCASQGRRGWGQQEWAALWHRQHFLGPHFRASDSTFNTGRGPFSAGRHFPRVCCAGRLPELGARAGCLTFTPLFSSSTLRRKGREGGSLWHPSPACVLAWLCLRQSPPSKGALSRHGARQGGGLPKGGNPGWRRCC